jgi:hypothetical protein
MGRQRAPVQLNQFIGGLNTESNPIGYPINATTDEQNASLQKDGSRRRRLGFDVEANYNEVDTGVTFNDSKPTGRNQFRWENPGGFANKQFLVVQIGNYLAVHDLDELIISTAPVYSRTFATSTYSTVYGLAVVDGILVIAAGVNTITKITYDGTRFTAETDTLLIRDFFGVEAVVDGVDLTGAQRVATRPSSINDAHLYNLRNQTFGLPRVDAVDEDIQDTIAAFYEKSVSTEYPSNADNVILHLGADPNVVANRTIDRYRVGDMFKNKPGTGSAPKGSFIIDALSRGASRLEQEAKLRAENSQLSLSVSILPTDTTPGGPKVLAQYAGRVWYAGFSAEVSDGDKLSPRMSSYVLFSQLVNDSSQITRCYQDADPTSNIDADLVATDGGFVKLDGAFNILGMIDLQDSLFVFAENGIWQITGSAAVGFLATSYSASRLGTEGCVGIGSIIRYEQTILYWSESAIYAVLQNETGGWSLENLTRDTIQTIYSAINTEDRSLTTGYYDIESDSFRWLYGNDLSNPNDITELVFNSKFKSFTKNKVSTTVDTLGPLMVSGGQKFGGNAAVPITADGETVRADRVDVFVNRTNLTRPTRTNFYTVVLSTASTITYTFGGFANENPLDWISLGAGVDNPAYITSGPLTGGDARLSKEIPYLTTYFSRTEDADLGDVESSCFASSRWDWKTSVDTGRWSTPRQMYRPTRTTDGHDLVQTRSRIRGRGHAVAIHFESEQGKTFRLYGWQHNLDSGTEE